MSLRSLLGGEGLIAPLLREPAVHLYNLRQEAYRNLALLGTRLSGAPRRSERKVSVHGWDLVVPDAASFLSTYRELFVNGIYSFESADPAPRILDLGANIGLSVLFFKRQHPAARIVAFEADPEIFSYLERNVRANGLQDVELINAAAWVADTTLRFLPDGADGGRVAGPGQGGAQATEVKAVNLSAFLNGRSFDFLKMDVEGAENQLLPAIRHHLRAVPRLFVEYHSRVGEKQELAGLLSLLSAEGFRVHLHSPHPSRAPFLGVAPVAGFDLLLNVFAWREGA
jgi:FkbM family methyltransferase